VSSQFPKQRDPAYHGHFAFSGLSNFGGAG